jgi:hypothetical protein
MEELKRIILCSGVVMASGRAIVTVKNEMKGVAWKIKNISCALSLSGTLDQTINWQMMSNLEM